MERICPGRVKEKEPLWPHTTLKIGGPAEWFIQTRSEGEVAAVIALAQRENIPWRVLGQGSNLLISDRGVKGLVLRLPVEKSPQVVRTFADGGVLVEVGAGYPLSRLVRFGIREGFEGLEFLAGIPGTAGGAWTMNAGSYGREIGEITRYLKTLSGDGRLMKKGKSRLQFSYRSLALMPGEIILSGGLRLKAGAREKIRRQTLRLWSQRRTSQPLGQPSCGSVFKNPPGDFAGRLIEEAGLKGRGRGGAHISVRHANFIVNTGRAGSGDVLYLMNLIRSVVRRKFGVLLEPEVHLWGCRLREIGTAVRC